MKPTTSLLATVLAALMLFVLPLSAQADAYEAPLPPQLNSDPDMCAYAPCEEVIPGADSFSERMGRPSYVEAYKTVDGKQTLLGYVFLSTDIVDIPAYSGKPIITLIGMDTTGKFTGSKILRHSEPILLLGIPESKLIDFTKQYLRQFTGDKLEIGRTHSDPEAISIDAISGATVTVIAQNQLMLRCGQEIARQVGIIQPKIRPQATLLDLDEKLDWAQLLKEGSIRRFTVKTAEVGLPPSPDPYIDMYFGYLNTPSVGRAILGDTAYNSLMSRLKADEHAIFIIANGKESFKGSGFVRGGIYDRIQINQDGDGITFRDLDYLNLYGIEAPGKPSYHESGIFIIRSPSFSAAYPWNLVFMGNKMDPDTGERTFATFAKEFWTQARYLEGGRPEFKRPDPTWLKVWKARQVEIAFFIALLLAAGIVYALRDKLVRRSNRKNKLWVSVPRYVLWITSIGFSGFYLMAQPSITQVLTWFHSILFQWQWGLFLSDPFIFLFWIFIIITTFFWGRGMFCGWLCPYGALSEILYKITSAIGLKRFQFQLPQAVHDKLKWLKYGIFLGLLFISFYSMGLAEKMAEVEPFKTTFLVGVWNRSWPFVLYFSVLFILAMFVERFFCKYLCPLGASLAIPSTFRWWGLKRKDECGPCKACAVGCDAQAIDNIKGDIDQRECMLCLDCMVMYYDDHACPPLAKERKARNKAGQPLTPIGADGYFIPIHPVSTEAAGATAAKVHERGIIEEQPMSLAARLYCEVTDHLFPWSSKVRSRNVFFKAAIAGITVLMTWLWLLGAAGKLGTGIILGWWLAWSVYEIIERMHCKPYVKEGPWWGRQLRAATWPDMMAYVGMKNLLIGVALFLLMKWVGVLDFLHNMPELQGFY